MQPSEENLISSYHLFDFDFDCLVLHGDLNWFTAIFNRIWQTVTIQQIIRNKKIGYVPIISDFSKHGKALTELFGFRTLQDWVNVFKIIHIPDLFQNFKQKL